MDEQLALHDHEIHSYLMQKRFPGGVLKCLGCDCTQTYRLGTGRYRCPSRKYTFNLTTGTWLARLKITAPKWLALVRAYDGMEPPSAAARSAQTSNATARRAYDVISDAIFRHQRQENEHAGHPLRHAAGLAESLVYGLVAADGLILAEPMRNFIPDEACLIQGVALAQLGRLVFTDSALGYDSLVFDLPSRGWDGGQKLEKRGRLRHPRLQGFWDFAAEKLVKRGWLSQSPLPNVLYELQFRYNHRERDICDRIMDILLQLAPEKRAHER